MARYLIGRIIKGLLSVIAVVGIVMVMIYTFLDKQTVFANDPVFSKQKSNAKQIYMLQQWERYGYLEYVSYPEYLQELLRQGQIDRQTYEAAAVLGKTEAADSDVTKSYVNRFREAYAQKGYTVERLNGDTQGGSLKYKEGGEPRLYARKDIPVLRRLVNYLAGLITVDHIHKAAGDVGERGLTFTLFDPVYGGKKFSPAILGNGTTHKYLLYFDDRFPFLHQNLVSVNLGLSYSVNKGVDVYQTMTESQGSFVRRPVTYPTGVVEESADDLHTATYAQGSLQSNPLKQKYFTDDYTNVTTVKAGKSRLGYSFTIGLLAVALSYLLAIPLGIVMARHKGKGLDRLGTAYIVFISAVPSLAYIFLFQTAGGRLGLPTAFDMENPTWLMYVLPILSLALPAVANLMKWLRRYLLDQLHADYVKFARAGGLSEGEILRKHVLKNAAIPILHGLPAGVLGALTGAIITERVYVVPGAGNLLTNAVNAYDNGVIVGITLFYALLTVVSVILGDVLITLADPRITFAAKEE